MKMDGCMWAYTVAVFSAGANFSSAIFNTIHHDSIGVLIAATSCAAIVAWASWVRASPRFDEAQNKDAAK